MVQMAIGTDGHWPSGLAQDRPLFVSSSFWRSLSKLHQRDSVFSQDAADAQKANQIYRETVEKANVAILEAKKKLEMSRELIEANELESHDEKIKVMKENQNQGWFPSATKKARSKVDGPRKHERSVTSG